MLLQKNRFRTLLGVNRDFTKYKLNYLNNIPNENKKFCENFINLLDKELLKFDNYFNFKNIYDEIKSEVFIDIVHTNNIGNKIFVQNSNKIIKK